MPWKQLAGGADKIHVASAGAMRANPGSNEHA
jgi:hypothetical protein